MNIVIAGATCSGKSTLALELSNTYSDVCIMPQDNYFKDLKDIPIYRDRYLMDSLNSFHYDEYYQDSNELISNSQVLIPRYDINENKRISKDLLILKKNLIIFEGLHAISILSSIPDSLKIYLDIDLDTCLARRIKRDSAEYGILPEVIEEHFKATIIPMYNEYIRKQKEKADIVIREGDDAKCLLKKYIN